MCDLLKANKNVVLKTDTTTIMIDHNQFFKGRCLAITNKHKESENEMTKEELTNFFLDCVKVGKLTGKINNTKKVNYAWLNNRDPHVHMHIIPRYKTDPIPNSSPFKEANNKKRIAKDNELNKIQIDIMKMLK